MVKFDLDECIREFIRGGGDGGDCHLRNNKGLAYKIFLVV